MKNNLKYIGVFALVAVIILPTTTFAARSESTVRNAGTQFCATLDKRATEVNSKIDDKKEKLDIRQHDRLNKKSADRSERDTKLEMHRDGWDDHRGERITKLEAKATTDAQKAAVAQFNTTMTAAINARRSAIDTAISTFRTGVDSITGTRVSAVDTAIATFKTARQSALEKAKTDCAAGVDSKTAKATFEASMKAALNTFKAAKTAVIKKNDVTVLSQARKAAIEKAVADFKVTMDAAQATLKLAFPKP